MWEAKSTAAIDMQVSKAEQWDGGGEVPGAKSCAPFQNGHRPETSHLHRHLLHPRIRALSSHIHQGIHNDEYFDVSDVMDASTSKWNVTVLIVTSVTMAQQQAQYAWSFPNAKLKKGRLDLQLKPWSVDVVQLLVCCTSSSACCVRSNTARDLLENNLGWNTFL